jgi:hypothetical protein
MPLNNIEITQRRKFQGAKSEGESTRGTAFHSLTHEQENRCIHYCMHKAALIDVLDC